MSGFAAIARFDGHPAEPAAIRRMTAAMSYRGPDGIDHWHGATALLGHCRMFATADERPAGQPLASGDGVLRLAMDGWLANRDELRAGLEDKGVRPRDRSDAQLVLCAYETWGEECCKRLDGEWAFVIWDGRSRTLFAARDPVGMRPLHWHWDGKRLLVASDIAGVLAAGDFEPRFNPGMIVEHLANEWYSLDETIWQDVMRLRPAHAMRTDATGPQARRYWLPPTEVTLRYPREADYVAHYRALLADSVRRASRTDRLLACEASGGLDSSAVFALAVREQADGRLLAPDLRGYTFRFPPGGCEDEREYADAVAAHLGVPLTPVEPFLPDIEWFIERGRLDRDLPIYPNAAMAVNVGRTVTGDGARVVLNGEGGDAFLGGAAHYFAELIHSRSWRSLARIAREDAAELGWPATLANVWQFGMGPLLPETLRSARRRHRVGREPVPDLLAPPLREMLRQRRENAPRPPHAPPSQRNMFRRLADPFSTYSYDVLSREWARNGYEGRSPMMSREMVEFAFASPQRLRIKGNEIKHVHREAMAGLLPQTVIRRQTKAAFNSSFERVLDKAFDAMVKQSPQCGMETFVDSEALQALRSRFLHSPSGVADVFEAWAVFGLWVSLRSEQGRG